MVLLAHGVHGRSTPKRGYRIRGGIAALMVMMALSACGGGSADDRTVEPPETAAPNAEQTGDVAPETPAPAAEPTAVQPPETPSPTAEPTAVPVTPLAINHVQVLGSHNSYHQIPEPALFEALTTLIPDLAASIEYSHSSLTEQLGDFGIRQFEIDVYADPDGGLFAEPAANPLVGLPPLDEADFGAPGFKVLHTPDYDYATSCLTFVACLQQVSAWSVANQNHLPLVIMVEFKSESVPEAAAADDIEIPVELAWATPLKPTADLLDALDAEIRSVFDADQIIEPDDVRRDAETLDAAITTTGWPALDASRGKVIFALIGPGVRDLYTAGAPSLEGRAMFTDAMPGDPDAAFMTIDDPTDPSLEAAALAGYLIRTRTDSPTAAARANDVSRRDAALASGAHTLSTDYYQPSEFFDSPYVVELPGGGVARCNPVTAPLTCDQAQLAE